MQIMFDEEAYLAANSDVAAAVRRGHVSSGKAHYESYGIRENRPLRPTPRSKPRQLPFEDLSSWSRRDKILAGLDLDHLQGVEIGALASPLVRSYEGNVVIVDHVGTEQLIAKYQHEPNVDPGAIANVDAIWGHATLAECLGGRKFDFVLASHVLEHVPDIISWLSEINEVLVDGGALRLVLPDRRFTFDYLRCESRSHDVLDAFLRKARAPLPRFILEHFMLVSEVDCSEAWRGSIDEKHLKRMSSAQFAIETARDALSSGNYHDTHCWVFTPYSFASLFLELAELGLIRNSCKYLFCTPYNDFEFIIGLQAESDERLILDSWRSLKIRLDDHMNAGEVASREPQCIVPVFS